MSTVKTYLATNVGTDAASKPGAPVSRVHAYLSGKDYIAPPAVRLGGTGADGQSFAFDAKDGSLAGVTRAQLCTAIEREVDARFAGYLKR